MLLCGGDAVVLALSEFRLQRVDEIPAARWPCIRGALSIMGPGKLIRDPANALSLGIALMFGTAGFPQSS